MKSIIFALVIYVFYSVMFDMDMAFLLPFMALMISISTFNYDDFNHWHSFAASLPHGKVNVVRSKYITTIGILIISTFVSMIISYIICNVNGGVRTDESFSTIMGELLAIIFMTSLLFPILFKYGSEKGRIVIMIFGLIIFGFVLLFTKVIHIEISRSFIHFIDSYLIIIFIVISLLMIIVSYLVSKRIYLKKEF